MRVYEWTGNGLRSAWVGAVTSSISDSILAASHHKSGILKGIESSSYSLALHLIREEQLS